MTHAELERILHMPDFSEPSVQVSPPISLRSKPRSKGVGTKTRHVEMPSASAPDVAPRSSWPSDSFDPHLWHSADPLVFARQVRRSVTTPLQANDFVELTCQLEGSSEREVNGKTMRLEAGDLLSLGENVNYRACWASEDSVAVNVAVEAGHFEEIMARFKRDFARPDRYPDEIVRSFGHPARNGYILCRSHDADRLSRYIRELTCECFDPRGVSPVSIDLLLSLILSECVMSYISRDDGKRNPPDVLFTASRYIDEHLTDCSLDAVAAECGMTGGSLSKLLKRQCGLTFMDLVQKRRLTEATRLLTESSMPAMAVARSVGYENVSFFYTLFRREYNATPNEFRARQQP